VIGGRPLLVVTPTLGRSRWLEEAVNSVRSHAGHHAAHTLVAPPEAVAGLNRRFPHCTVLPDRMLRGVYPAINQGLAAAAPSRWKWFTWLNDDDELLPGFSRQLAAAIEHDGDRRDAPWFYGRVRISNSAGEDLGSLAVARSPQDLSILAQAQVNPLNQQGMLAPRAWVDALAPLRADLRICADVDFWLRAVQEGARFRYSGRPVALFRLRPGQVSGDLGLHRSEFREVAGAIVPRPCGAIRRRFARARFRVGNAFVYAERLRRCGWKGGLDLLEHPVGRSP
jgi:GT2 family glycosyltransferase